MKSMMQRSRGFTLIEIMVSMVISSLVIGGIYGVYTIQQRSYTVQEQVSEMQQKIRSGLAFMMSEMRSVGYSPGEPYDKDGTCGGAKILTATSDNFAFEYCKVERNISAPTTYIAVRKKSEYSLYSTDNIQKLGVKHDNGDNMPLVEGVDAIEFRYLKHDGSVATDVDDIRVVQISLLVRASYEDPRYTNTIKYVPASKAADWDINGSSKSGSGNPANDHYHRQLLITSIELRNMGLQ